MSFSKLLNQLPAWILGLLLTVVSESAVDAAHQLASGDTRVVLTTDDDQLLVQWGVSNGKLLEPGEPVRGKVDGVPFGAADLEVVDTSHSGQDTETPTLTATLRHKEQPVEYRLVFVAQGDTGVIETSLECINKGESPVELEAVSSLACRIERGTIHTLKRVGNEEWNLRESKLREEPIEFGNRNAGRSSGRVSPWWAVVMPKAKMTMMAQLAYSGNWRADFVPTQKQVHCRFGMVFDDERPLTLAGGANFTLPTVAVAVSAGDDLDTPANAHHRHQRKFVFLPRPEGIPLLVQYNTWYAFANDINEQKMLDVIPLAAKIGCEVFVIDAGWYGNEATSGPAWKLRSGDWRVDREKFPSGLGRVIQAAHDHGMKFGIWIEPELVSTSTETFRNHPEWCLSKDGQPVVVDGRAHLDFANPQVREYMMGVVEQLQQNGPIDWVKLDYNIDIGGSFDSLQDDIQHTRLHDHLAGYNLWLAELHAKYPNMIIENCASGAKRWDNAIQAHTHSSWVSDTVNPRNGPQLIWGSLLHSAPEMCNRWMVGDVPEGRRSGTGGELVNNSRDWWEFMHLVAMGGQYGISARIDKWPNEALEHAADCVERYKRFRRLIENSDVYHLTPQPAAGLTPKGWMAVEFLQPDQHSGLVLAFRLEGGSASKVIKLKGLDPVKRYRVTIQGQEAVELTGQSLIERGLKLEASSSWRAQAIEFELVE